MTRQTGFPTSRYPSHLSTPLHFTSLACTKGFLRDKKIIVAFEFIKSLFSYLELLSSQYFTFARGPILRVVFVIKENRAIKLKGFCLRAKSKQ